MLFSSLGAWAQEICDDGIDNDGDNLIDCFDPDCCASCADHYFFDCDTVCSALQLKDSLVLRTLWRQENEWNRVATPIVGRFEGQSARIVGLSNSNFSPLSDRGLTIVDGNTGAIVRQIPTAAISRYAQGYAMADVNQDGEGEIIAALSDEAINDRRLICYTPAGTILWDSDERYGYSDRDVTMHPSFADFDGNGLPEVYIGNQIFNASANGNLLASGGATNNIGLQEAKDPLYRLYATVAADVLPDAACPNCTGLELVAGNQVFSVDLNTSMMEVVREGVFTDFGDGLTSVADMNNDFNLDVVVAQRVDDFVHIFIWSPVDDVLLGHYIHTVPSPNSFSGGSSVPLLTDLDLDGRTDIVFTTTEEMVVLRNTMTGFDLFWRKPTQDLSGRSGPVSFDFDGNGFPEIVHRDGAHLRLLEGISGRTIDSVECYSPTFYEKPVVANIDDDPSAEILCSCDGGLVALTSGFSQWASARPVWNQMNFHNTHINDDLSIPSIQQNQLFPEINGRRPLNRFNEQYSQPDRPTADLLFGEAEIICFNGDRYLNVRLCNEGDVRAPAGFSVQVFDRNPILFGNAPDTAFPLPQPINIDDCLSYQFHLPSSLSADTAFVFLNALEDNLPIDTLTDEGFGTLECRYDNNLVALDLASFNSTSLALGNDTTFCADEGLLLLPQADNVWQYQWSDGSEDSSLWVDAPGLYALTITDFCGNTASDEIDVSQIIVPPIQLPELINLCSGQEVPFALSNFLYDSIVWSYNGQVVCAQCERWQETVTNDGLLVIETFIEECLLTDSTSVVVEEAPMSSDSVWVCPGATYNWNGREYGPGSHTNSFDVGAPCDSVALLYVLTYDSITYELETEPECVGSKGGRVEVRPGNPETSILWSDGSTSFTRNELAAGNYSFTLSSPEGCTVSDELPLEEVFFPVSNIDIIAGNCRNNGRASVTFRPLEEEVLLFWEGRQLDSGTLQMMDLSGGSYLLEASFKGCQFDSLLEVPEYDPDGVYADELIYINEGDTVILGEEFGPNLQQVRWEGGSPCMGCLPLIFAPTENKALTLLALDEDSCSVFKNYFISVEEIETVYVPNIFTPNGDGINDILSVYGRERSIELVSFQIYDRWGNLLAETQNVQGEDIPVWDGFSKGREAREGVYVYQLRLRSGTGQTQTLFGTVTLVR
jgi:gliding motility-associated-like protein